MMPSTKALLMLENALSNSPAKKHLRAEAEERTKEAEESTRKVIAALSALKEASITAAIAHDDAAMANEKCGNTGRGKHHKCLALAHREYMASLGTEDEAEEMQQIGVTA